LWLNSCTDRLPAKKEWKMPVRLPNTIYLEQVLVREAVSCSNACCPAPPQWREREGGRGRRGRREETNCHEGHCDSSCNCANGTDDEDGDVILGSVTVKHALGDLDLWQSNLAL